MDCNLKNTAQVSIIHLSTNLEFNTIFRKLQDLYKSKVIVYAKICNFEKPIDHIPSTYMIMRFYKRRRISQIQKYFPEAHIEKINSWKILKENMGDREIISNGHSFYEILYYQEFFLMFFCF